MAVSLLQAKLTTVCLESLLYDGFLVLAITSTIILARRRLHTARLAANTKSGRWRAVASPMIVGMVCLLFGNTMYWILSVIRLFQAFVYYKGGKAPTAFYGDLPQPTMVALTGVMIFCVAVGDAMVIYRLWVIRAYNVYVVVLPVLSLFDTTAGRWVIGNVVCTLCTNVYCTAMIVSRIWKLNTADRPYCVDGLTAVSVVIIESAALYTAWSMFCSIAYQLKSELQNVAIETLPAVAGISLTLINVRASLGRTLRTSQRTSHIEANVIFVRGPSRTDPESESFPMDLSMMNTK